MAKTEFRKAWRQVRLMLGNTHRGARRNRHTNETAVLFGLAMRCWSGQAARASWATRAAELCVYPDGMAAAIAAGMVPSARAAMVRNVRDLRMGAR
jgi:hypothetical protein